MKSYLGKKKNSKQAKNKGVTTDEDWADRSIAYLDQMVASQENASHIFLYRNDIIEHIVCVR